MNRVDLAFAIFHLIGLRAKPDAKAEAISTDINKRTGEIR
jgi:hypothetical protein